MVGLDIGTYGPWSTRQFLLSRNGSASPCNGVVGYGVNSRSGMSARRRLGSCNDLYPPRLSSGSLRTRSSRAARCSISLVTSSRRDEWIDSGLCAVCRRANTNGNKWIVRVRGTLSMRRLYDSARRSCFRRWWRLHSRIFRRRRTSLYRSTTALRGTEGPCLDLRFIRYSAGHGGRTINVVLSG